MSNFGQGSVSSDNDMPPSLYSKGKNRMLEPDDWKNIQDQKEKKKIQNRVAQRTYSNIPSQSQRFLPLSTPY